MAINNDIYYNAALLGALAGSLDGRAFTNPLATSYAPEVNAAEAFALELDSLIAEDALVTTGAGDASQLAITTSLIASNEQWRAGLIQALARSQFSGRDIRDVVPADYLTAATAVFAAWTQGITKITNAA